MGTLSELRAGGRTSRVDRTAPAAGGGPLVMVLHPWWGLNGDVMAFADRLTAAGFVVAAPDLYGGTVATTIDAAERLSEGSTRQPRPRGRSRRPTKRWRLPRSDCVRVWA